MKKAELKETVIEFLYSMINKWFDTNSFQDNICRAGAKTIIHANQDKYDKMIDLFTDINGDVLLSEFIDSILENFEDYTIDLTEYNIPVLPRKILILSKKDLMYLKAIIMDKNKIT